MNYICETKFSKMPLELARPNRLCKRLVVVDGLPGSGKTMMSAVISSLERVELFKYSNEIETYCLLNYFGNIDTKTSTGLIKNQIDWIIYNQMMARETNFRFSDLSSVFKSNKKFKYFKRLFGPGDEAVPRLIEKQKPILHLVTHCLSAFAKPLLDSLEKNMILVNFHRNPLFMLKQNMWNMENLIFSIRDFHLYYKLNNKKFPYYFKGQEEKMNSATPLEKVIYFLEFCRKIALNNTFKKYEKNYYELTFESFVSNPFPHISEMEKLLNTKQTSNTPSILKREKIPRTNISHGRDMPIYRRVNWEKNSLKTRDLEINELYRWADKQISDSAKKSLDWLLDDYNQIVIRLEKK